MSHSRYRKGEAHCVYWLGGTTIFDFKKSTDKPRFTLKKAIKMMYKCMCTCMYMCTSDYRSINRSYLLS